MLPSPREIEQAAIGCWTMVRGRESGLSRFDLTMDGFWRSFQWAFALAILDAADALYARGVGPAMPAVMVLIVSGIASFLSFVVFPVIVAALARIMHLGKAYAPYIVARNWLTVFLSIPVYLLDGPSAGGVLPDQLRDPVIIALLVITLFAGMTFGRLILKVNRSVAFGFAFMDFLLALLIGEAAAQLLG
jgi:hypothetical protein